jgi:hypothetical protein
LKKDEENFVCSSHVVLLALKHFSRLIDKIN